MKPVHLTLAAIAVAALSGAGGYHLGKNRGEGRTTSATTWPRTVSENPDAATRRAPEPDLGKLRASLDAERNPLVRFKLALRNMESWVARDPKGAMDWLASQQASDRRNEVIQMALHQYSDIDPKGAAEWVMSNLTDVEQDNSLLMIAENWAEQNGKEAAAWFGTLPATGQRDAALETILFAWGSNEPKPALDFIQSSPALGELSPTLRRAALAGWAKSDPLGAVATSLALSQANDDPDQFANTVANWATADLETSSQWLLANLAPGAERSAAAQELATIYAQQSPAAGVAWLDKLSAGDERDAAASALVSSWSRISPAETAKWAMSQHTSTLTPEAMGIIARNYFMKYPTEFEAWQATLPPGVMKSQASQVGSVGSGE